jgi:hypothetical protein
MIPGSNDAILIMRLLRLLLVMKLAKKFPKLQLVVLTLLEGAGTILAALMLLSLMLALFAIIGCSIFGRNDPWHFGDFSMALITLIRCATFDDWTDVMYTNMYGCDVYHGSDFNADECKDPRAQWTVSVIYFCFFVLAANMVFLNALMGVIITSMQKVVTAMQKDAQVTQSLKMTRLKYGIPKRSIKLYRRAFNLINIEGTNCLSPDELLVALRGADIDVSRRAVLSILKYALIQQSLNYELEDTKEFERKEEDVLSQSGRKSHIKTAKSSGRYTLYRYMVCDFCIRMNH